MTGTVRDTPSSRIIMKAQRLLSATATALYLIKLKASAAEKYRVRSMPVRNTMNVTIVTTDEMTTYGSTAWRV